MNDCLASRNKSEDIIKKDEKEAHSYSGFSCHFAFRVLMCIFFHLPGGNSLPGQPVIGIEEIIPVAEPLTPYGFQVRTNTFIISFCLFLI